MFLLLLLLLLLVCVCVCVCVGVVLDFMNNYFSSVCVYVCVLIFFYVCMSNPEELKNKDKIKEILDPTKIIKSQRQPKNIKRILTSPYSEKTPHNGLPNLIINDSKYVI